MRLISSRLKIIFALLTALLISNSAVASEILPNTDVLFAGDTAIAVSLEAPFSELFANKEKVADKFLVKKLKVIGKLIYGEAVIPVEIRMRGFSSLTKCKFPKLTLKISKTAAVGTIFEGLEKVDLSTHCEATKNDQNFMGGMEFAHREALVYRWLKIMDIPAYSIRMASVTYKDSSLLKPLPSVTKPAFFIENLSSFLKRADGIEIRSIVDLDQHPASPDTKEHRAAYREFGQHPQIDRTQLARITLFENLIGNYDYLLERDLIWNLKLIELKDGRWFPIPLDFNLSGVSRGEEVRDISYNEFFSGAEKDLQLKLIEELVTKKELLYQAITLLESNSVGMNAFREALNSKLKALEILKSELLKTPTVTLAPTATPAP